MSSIGYVIESCYFKERKSDNMLSIISVGITKYRSGTLKDIPCAGNDAKCVYSAFSTIMGSEFRSFSSVCLVDIQSQDFWTLLRNEIASSQSEEDNDVLVIYFSGHAILKKDDRLGLCFSDYCDTISAISVDQVYDLIKESGRSVLLVLDCCYSGTALKHAPSTIGNSRCCILTSCDDIDTSRFDCEGSYFTQALCNAIYEIESTGDEFTLSTLSQKIADSGYKNAMINFGSSNVKDISFILKQKSNFYTYYNDFAPRFIHRLNHSNATLREAMWYSLVDVPEAVTYDICEMYFGLKSGSVRSISEASWLVRRSIGSIISCLSDTKRKEQLLKFLLSSCFWQEQCIGLIGARYLIRNQKKTFDFVADKIKDGTIVRIDAVWLANLYMSENDLYTPEVFYGTTLISTAWGSIELYKTLKKSKLYSSDALSIICGVVSEENYKSVQGYISLNSDKKSNKLVQQLRKAKSRGRFPEKERAKFLLSALYGSWRDQLNVDLKDYLSTESKKTIVDQLEKAKEFASVEYKMGILLYFQTLPDKAKKYVYSVDWALYDDHFWVRREAIKLFKLSKARTPSLENCLKSSDISNNLYSGLLDMLLEFPPADYQRQLEKYSQFFVENDLSALQHAMALEYP